MPNRRRCSLQQQLVEGQLSWPALCGMDTIPIPTFAPCVAACAAATVAACWGSGLNLLAVFGGGGDRRAVLGQMLRRWGLADDERALGATQVFYGPIIHSRAIDRLEVLPVGLLGVDPAGTVCFLLDTSAFGPSSTAWLDPLRRCSGLLLTELGHRMLLPGFVDAHAHAPQHAFTGTALDLPLLQWLERYTFPTEARFRDLEYAREVYGRAVRAHLKHGTTTVSYFATIHKEACNVLVDICRELGQRAFVPTPTRRQDSPGSLALLTKTLPVVPPARYAKQSNQTGWSRWGKSTWTATRHQTTWKPRRSPYLMCVPYLVHILPPLHSRLNSLADAVAQTREFVGGVLALRDPLITPVITPRFVPSCTSELMRGLAQLSEEYCLPIQSHLSESIAECDWVHSLHPESSSYSEVYDTHGLYTNRTYMAHCIHCGTTERSVLFVFLFLTEGRGLPAQSPDISPVYCQGLDAGQGRRCRALPELKLHAVLRCLQCTYLLTQFVYQCTMCLKNAGLPGGEGRC